MTINTEIDGITLTAASEPALLGTYASPNAVIPAGIAGI